MKRDDLREVIARAICRVQLNGGDPDQPAVRWNGTEMEPQSFPAWRDYMDESEHSLSALDAAGMVVVPKEPTEAMILVGHRQIDWSRNDQKTDTPYDPSQVFMTGGSWCVTYRGGTTSEAAVMSLKAKGLIRPVYSNMPNDCFHIGPTIDCDATMAARKRYGNRHPLLYVEARPAKASP